MHYDTLSHGVYTEINISTTFHSRMMKICKTTNMLPYLSSKIYANRCGILRFRTSGLVALPTATGFHHHASLFFTPDTCVGHRMS